LKGGDIVFAKMVFPGTAVIIPLYKNCENGAAPIGSRCSIGDAPIPAGDKCTVGRFVTTLL